VKRLARLTFILFAALSLLVFTAAVLLGVQSYRVQYVLSWWGKPDAGDPTLMREHNRKVLVGDGDFAFIHIISVVHYAERDRMIPHQSELVVFGCGRWLDDLLALDLQIDELLELVGKVVAVRCDIELARDELFAQRLGQRQFRRVQLAPHDLLVKLASDYGLITFMGTSIRNCSPLRVTSHVQFSDARAMASSSARESVPTDRPLIVLIRSPGRNRCSSRL
jgi:hypothetical protein